MKIRGRKLHNLGKDSDTLQLVRRRLCTVVSLWDAWLRYADRRNGEITLLFALAIAWVSLLHCIKHPRFYNEGCKIGPLEWCTSSTGLQGTVLPGT
mmetsp:Transcript_26019/g.38454  ORF Transcript_26019/g.38454 Transcript_26019/m.38454 type:complete len:96 (-) Transcript_26019:1894-2181(-)